MIALQKLPCPKILSDNAARWTELIVAKLANGEELTSTDKRRYSHGDIKAALLAETHGKCAYCESKIRHVSFGDIEHIEPKSLSPELWVEWTNLTLACTVCNNYKSDYDATEDNFVDPYLCNPEDRFDFLGPFFWAKPGDDAARLAEEILQLNRVDLYERRLERLKQLRRHTDAIAQTQNPDVKQVLIQDFQRECDSDREYAALARMVVSGFTS